jgi:hypothetical protein
MIRTIRARALFLAAILLLTLSVSAAAQEQELEVVTLLPHTSEAFGLESARCR